MAPVVQAAQLRRVALLSPGGTSGGGKIGGLSSLGSLGSTTGRSSGGSMDGSGRVPKKFTFDLDDTKRLGGLNRTSRYSHYRGGAGSASSASKAAPPSTKDARAILSSRLGTPLSMSSPAALALCNLSSPGLGLGMPSPLTTGRWACRGGGGREAIPVAPVHLQSWPLFVRGPCFFNLGRVRASCRQAPRQAPVAPLEPLEPEMQARTAAGSLL